MGLIKLFKVINESKNGAASINICSIVNGKALSSVGWISQIEKALFINFEGKYDMGDNALEFYATDDREGLLIKFDNGSTLFLPNEAKVKHFEDEGHHVFDIKDNYSSMHIQFQILTSINEHAK